MQLRHVKVCGFRGIKSLDWTVDGRTVGLIGPGDSTKTTILDAVEYALWPRWSLLLYDSDFHGGRPLNPIQIEVTVGELPGALVRDDKFGLYLRGWRSDGIVDEPEEAAESVLTIRLAVSTDLEPTWTVATDRHGDGMTIGWRDRAKLGVTRLGSEMTRDLAWGRASALSRLGSDDDIGDVLAKAYRNARDAITPDQLGNLGNVAARAAQAALELGVNPVSGFLPALDPATMSIPTGAISLHDGALPVRSSGLGTRRLVALAIQRALVKEGAIVLVDELEYGLEPHRIRHLVRVLRRGVHGPHGEHATEAMASGQVVFTTHSAHALVELDAAEVRVVRTEAGETEVQKPEPGLQGIMRSEPEGLLGRRLVVCEGATEVGMCWGMEAPWQALHDDVPLACLGVVFLDGEGSSAPQRALDLARLGYPTAYFADSDRATSPSREELEGAGIEVIVWDGASTEERVFADLPLDRLQQVLDLAVNMDDEDQSRASIRDSAAHYLGARGSAFSLDLSASIEFGVSETEMRNALGCAAKRNGWYKNCGKGKDLAPVVAEALPVIPNSDLAVKLRQLEMWCYA